MRRMDTRVLARTLLMFLTCTAATLAQAPSVTSISPNSGAVGSSIVIVGSSFGMTQGSSTVLLNGTSAAVASWSDTSIVATVPVGATSGSFSVTVNGQSGTSSLFTITSLPQGWSDGDIGSVGVAGSATYSNGTFTVKGAGTVGGSADGLHFGYQSLSGDGTIIARVLTMQGGTSPTAGVMIRESLSANSKQVYAYATSASGGYFYQQYRSTTGGYYSYSYTANTRPLPTYVKLVRAGNSFTGSYSFDAVNWVQIANVSVTMAQNVYVGLGVSSASTTSATTATLDSVSISSSVMTAPSISTVSTTNAGVGATIGIGGSNFGASQGNGVVMLNGLPMTILTWTPSSIVFTIPTGATTGYLFVSTGPTMNASNAIYFQATGHPIPTEWLDQDIGLVAGLGSASFANGTFTVSGGGVIYPGGNTSDGNHFAYQPLSGDGTIIARVVSLQGGSPYYATAGVMIRETLSPSSSNANVSFISNLSSILVDRTSTAGASASTAGTSMHFPYWVKLVRSGSIFSGYSSLDGISWVQVGSNVTISMAQNVYVGLAVSSGSATTGISTATFDNVSVNTSSDPQPTISSVSATTGPVGTQVAISGSNFGASQGASAVTLGGSPVTVNLWSANSIVITIPAGAASGLLLVSVAPDSNDSNAVYFTVTSQPLPIGWDDSDVGQIGPSGNATFSNGTFTITGSGSVSTTGSVDGFHFVYQSMSGDGSIVARVVSRTNNTNFYASAGAMIRETLFQGSTHANSSSTESATNAGFVNRTATSGTATTAYVGAALPGWVKVVRAGNTFSGYKSTDGVTWVQVGSNATISMAQTVYVGLAVGSGSTTTSSTATLDNVSVTVGTTPYLSGLSPALGPVGTSVTIAGSNFGATQGSSTITFNGVLASVTSWSNSQIVATVPAATPDGSGTVTVTVNSIASVPALQFTAIKPVITSLGPPAAPASSIVILNGTGFGANQVDSQVYFNGISASIYSWSATSVSVGVPPNATSGPITMVRGGVTSNSAQFTLLEALSVGSISPASGRVGATVTINGAGFGPTQSNSIASFYGAAANVVSWSDTQIVTTVPVGTSTGNVTVTVAGTTAAGPAFFLASSLALTDSLGNATTYNAQVVGGVWRVTDSQGSGCSSCTQRGTIQSTFDGSGNVLTRTDELGRITTYTYDSNGNVQSQSQPDGNGHTVTTSYTYNSFNEVLTTTDPLGNVTTNTYDTHGNLLTVTTPRPNNNTNASLTQFAYNSLGQMTQITDPLSHNTILTYTSAGLIYTIKDAQNNLTTYAYDTHGNRTSVTDALNHQTTFAYDTGDRLKTITYPDTTSTTFNYDSRGRRTSVIDQNGKTTTYAYDDADRLTSVTDAASNVTTYGYDTENNLKTIKDANNHTTSFDYDEFGRVKKTTFPSGYIETYNYDAVGNLLNKTDRKNQLITYAYDGLNRLTQKSYPDTTTVNYTYDLGSRLTQVTDPTGTYQFTFDNMGRLTAASTSYTFLTARNFTTGYSYDAASNRTGFTDPESGSTTYAYDTLNRLQTLTPPSAFSGTGSFGFGYDALSRRTQMTRPNNVATNYAYDNLSRLQSVLHQLAGSTIDGATYTVDNAGNRTAKTDQRTAVASSYGYDNIYQLLSATPSSGTAESYAYDPVGNRLSSAGVPSYSYNSSNELTSTSSATYGYDNNGSTVTKTDSTGITTYAWDFENRVTSVTLPGSGGTVSFKYDPFGRRIYKSSSSGTSIYAYDHDNLIEEVNASGGAVARYSHTDGTDEPVAMLRSSSTSYYQADSLGTITSLSNASGTLVQTYVYDSFGQQAASSGSLTNPFRFTGREFDVETGLYYYRERYMDASTGRFISEDPIRFSGGANFYTYVGNEPTSWIDPLGLREGSPSNLAKRAGIDKIARGYNGSLDWGKDKKKDNFPAGTWKCNKFVCDVLNESGTPMLVKVKGAAPRCARAGDIANPNWTPDCWRTLGPNETPEAGDVAAYPLTDPSGGNAFSGHTGIITSSSEGNISAHGDGVYPQKGQFGPTVPGIIFRRFTCD
jgi:RHS repeat-associated protein